MIRSLPLGCDFILGDFALFGTKARPLQTHTPKIKKWTTNDGEGEAVDGVTALLARFGLSKYEAALRENGLEELSVLNELDTDDIQSIAKEAKIPTLHRKKFMKAVESVKMSSMTALEKKILALRKSRQHLKGIVEIKRQKKDPCSVKNNRTVIILGQTGAGKTTLINSMMNHLFHVGYEEKMRFKLIAQEETRDLTDGPDETDETPEAKWDADADPDQTKSQTQFITSYHLEDCPAIPYSLTIVDTPGFGDTHGPKKDKFIRGQFKDFFENIFEIHAIYFIVKASEVRLMATQKYIFNMVLELFGQNVRDNIFVIFTFSDGDDPPALAAVKGHGVPFKDYFQINNSGFGLKETPSQLHSSFFDLGNKQLKMIFEALHGTSPVSIQQTNEVLQERDNIKAWLTGIGEQVKLAMDRITAAHKTKQFIETHEAQIDANKDFLVPYEHVEIKQDPVSHYTTHCDTCVFTCHKDCAIPNDSGKKGCASMSDGYCVACPSKCKWSEHTNKPYLVRRVTETRQRTLGAVADKFNMAKNEKLSCENVMRAILKDIVECEKRIKLTIIAMKNSINRLREIALQKNVLSEEKYFDTLIEAEESEKSKGYQDRIAQLRSMKLDNKLLHDIMENKEATPWKHDATLQQYASFYLDHGQDVQIQKPNFNTNTSSDVAVSVGIGDWKLEISRKKQKKRKLKLKKKQKSK